MTSSSNFQATSSREREIDVILLVCDDESSLSSSSSSNRQSIIQHRLDFTFFNPLFDNIIKSHSINKNKSESNASGSNSSNPSPRISFKVASVIYHKDDALYSNRSHPLSNSIPFKSFSTFHNSHSSILDFIPRSYNHSTRQTIGLDQTDNHPLDWSKDQFGFELLMQLDHSEGEDSAVEMQDVSKSNSKGKGKEKAKDPSISSDNHNHHPSNLIQALKTCLELFESRSTSNSSGGGGRNDSSFELQPEITARYLIHLTSSNHHHQVTHLSPDRLNQMFNKETYSSSCIDSQHDFWSLSRVCQKLGNGIDEDGDGLNIAILTILINDDSSNQNNITSTNTSNHGALDPIDEKIHSTISTSQKSSTSKTSTPKSESPIEFFERGERFMIPSSVKKSLFNGWIKNSGRDQNAGGGGKETSTKVGIGNQAQTQGQGKNETNRNVSNNNNTQSNNSIPNQNQFPTQNQNQQSQPSSSSSMPQQVPPSMNGNNKLDSKSQFVLIQQQITALMQSLNGLAMNHSEHVKAIAQKPTNGSGYNNPLPHSLSPEMMRRGQFLEGFRRAILSQQQALRNAADSYRSGGQPNLAPIFQNLINIEKESGKQGMELKGSWNLPTSFSTTFTTNASSSSNSSTASNPNAAAGGGVKVNNPIPNSTTNVNVRPQAPTAGTQVWFGSLVWSINQNVPDPNGGLVNGQPKMISQKKDVTMGLKAFVPSSMAVDAEKLLLPWPSRLHMTTVLNIASTEMQSMAKSRGLSILFFTPSCLNPTSIESETANEGIFRSLCRSLGSKNLCAFSSHDPKNVGASNGGGNIGIALVPINIPNPNAGNQPQQQPNTKLIGIVFNEPFHFPPPAGSGSGSAPNSSNANNASKFNQMSQQQQQQQQQQFQQMAATQNFNNNQNQNQNLGFNPNFNFNNIDMAQLQMMMQQNQNQGGGGNGQPR